MDPSGHCSKDPDGGKQLPAVIPEGKQLPAIYVPQQEALLRWYANFQNDTETGHTGNRGANPNGTREKIVEEEEQEDKAEIQEYENSQIIVKEYFNPQADGCEAPAGPLATGNQALSALNCCQVGEECDGSNCRNLGMIKKRGIG